MKSPLPIDEVHIWISPDDAADANRLRQYHGLLSDEEIARCDRFYRHGDRVRFLLARAMARTMLSRYADVEPEAWRFCVRRHGRPEIVGPPGAPDLRFNLSHTDGLVACAVTAGRDVGIDVECIDRPVSRGIAERFFSPDEVADLHALPAEAQAAAFFDYWTLKEAYIKARALGFAERGQFAFRRSAEGAPVISFGPALDDDPATWQFAQFRPTPLHRMAVAVRRVGADLPIDVATVVPEVSG